MRRTITVVVGSILFVTVWLQGCTSTSPTQGRLAVTSALRQSCNGAPDREIQAIITIVDDARTGGAAKNTTLGVFADACAGDAATEEGCITCTAAIIEQVYSQ